MKRLPSLALSLLLSGLPTMVGAETPTLPHFMRPGLLQSVPLKSGVYSIPLRGTLTIQLPGPVSAEAFSGAGFTVDPTLFEGDILIEVRPPSPIVHLTALKANFTARNLNLIHKNTLLCFYLYPAAREDTPLFGLIFEDPGVTPPRITVRRSSDPPRPAYPGGIREAVPSFLNLLKMIAQLEEESLRDFVRTSPRYAISLRENDERNFADHSTTLHRVMVDEGTGLIGIYLTLQTPKPGTPDPTTRRFHIRAGSQEVPVLSHELSPTPGRANAFSVFLVGGGVHHEIPTNRHSAETRFTVTWQ